MTYMRCVEMRANYFFPRLRGKVRAVGAVPLFTAAHPRDRR